MRLQGEVYRESKLIGMDSVDVETSDAPLGKRLDSALLKLCKTLVVPIPIWLDNNTKQFATFRMTIFFPDQFVDQVAFDHFQIRLFEDEAEACKYLK